MGSVFVVLKVLHELGHGFAAKAFGGEVHDMGVMFLVFTPVPYVDASSSWAFASKGQRALVAAGGMIAELFVAALAFIALFFLNLPFPAVILAAGLWGFFTAQRDGDRGASC